MAYTLLTGATGLLGAYLLKDALVAGHSMAVVARASNIESSRQRVEAILARWERAAGTALPRPVILEGDISKADLGLDRRQLDWLRQHCQAIVHNAASLSFQADEKTGEPWRSNVDGTRNVLELCRTTGIRKFHYVSTAYVCGLRGGRILESELDEGQEFANIYEQSKVAAEKLVRAADFLDGPTFYRPAIIVGDWHTGYTSTFHGFYTPLKVICGLASMIDPDAICGAPLMAALGLTGREAKNFVPVDWVSAVMVHILGRPEQHGQTYHLTPPRRVALTLWREVLEEVIKLHLARSNGANRRAKGELPLESLFRTQMDTYRSYWRDDPEFDATNTTRAAGHLPCPELDRDALSRLCRFAIESNFGWPRPRPVTLEFDVDECLSPLSAAAPLAPGQGVRFGLQVNGAGGGQWQVTVRGSHVVGVEPGLPAKGEPMCYLNSKSFQRLTAGNGAAKQLLQTGRLVIEGTSSGTEQVETALKSLVAAIAPNVRVK